MAIPDYQSLMRPLLEKAQGAEWRMVDLAKALADDLQLTAEERVLRLPSGKQQVFNNRLHWAKLHLDRAGFIASISHGVFRTTPAGTAFLDERTGPISKAILEALPFYRQPVGTATTSVAHAVAKGTETGATPQERIAVARDEITGALSVALLERVYQSGAAFFETLIVQVLVAMGYGGTHDNAAKAIGGSADGGVDGVIDEDRLGLDQIYIQAKCYQPETSVGSPALQGFVGALAGKNATKGVFVTTSSSSKNAREYVNSVAPRISLIDGAMLARLMIEHGVGVRTEQTIVLQSLDEEFFDPS